MDGFLIGWQQHLHFLRWSNYLQEATKLPFFFGRNQIQPAVSSKKHFRVLARKEIILSKVFYGHPSEILRNGHSP